VMDRTINRSGQVCMKVLAPTGQSSQTSQPGLKGSPLTVEQHGQKLPRLLQALDPARPAWVVRIEAIENCLSEVAILAKDNFEESRISSSLDYRPDWNELYKYIVGNKVLFISARYEGTLIGYCWFLIGPFKHNHTVEYADLETIYVHPSFRDTRIAFQMYKLAEKELTDKVAFILASCNAKYNKFFKHFGYDEVETVHMKRLDHGSKESTSRPTESS
jgi:GNAT superfamily N-acetyltransferase